MRKGRFYHRTYGVLASLLALCLTISPAKAQGIAPPPRSTDDIARLLDHYRPDPAVAARLTAEAGAVPPATEDRGSLFRFYWMRGLAAGKTGRMGQQIADLRKAAEYGDKGTADFVRMLRNLASAETQGGNLLLGARIAEEGWRQTPQNQKGQMLAAEQLLTRQYVVLGDFETARRHLREAEATFTLLRRSPRWNEYGHNWTAMMERARAEIFSAEGRQIEAEGAFRKALRNVELHIEHAAASQTTEARLVAEGMPQFREGMERSLARTLLAQGKLVEAEIHARQAIRHSLERAGRGSIDTAQGLGLLSRIVAEYGRNQESIRLAQEALESYRLAGAAPESVTVAGAQRALAAALVSEGKYAEAMAVFHAMREGLRKDPELLRKVGSNDLDWVLALLRTGDQPGAERMAKAMLEGAARRFGSDAPKTATVRAFYAMTLAARGARDEALRLFRAAVPALLDRARGDAEAETGTVKRQQRLVVILESYLKLLSEAEDPGAHADESFRLADVARNSAVQRALTASAARANIADPRLATLARREQDAQRRIGALSELLTQLIGAPPDQQLPKIQAKMREDIDALRQERERLKKEIAAKFPDYAELVDPKPATLAGTAKVLRPGEALLAFYFGEEAGFVWALRADGKAAFARVALTHAALGKTVASLRKALDPQVSSVEELPPFDISAAHGLYQKLLKPVESVWQGEKALVIVPHADLGQLPLALLPIEAVPQPGRTAIPFAGYRSVPWLVRKLAVSQLPSVTALASLRRLPPGDPERRPFIGFGDPLFSRAQAQEADLRLAAAGSVKTRGLPLRLRNTPRTVGIDSADLALLPRLPETGEEIRDIARLLHADPAQDVFLQIRATEKAVFEADLSKRRIVMFATHGLVPGDLDGLTQPALALTAPEVTDGNGDGLLTLDEILGLRLDADWVVLSACNTAAGQGSGTEAVSGLGRAFFYAGARALLASNWPVETASARALMTDLFRRQNGEHGKAEALRQAMLALFDGPGAIDASSGKPLYSYAHPLFWAPFVVVGD